jgi:hypothetical protein
MIIKLKRVSSGRLACDVEQGHDLTRLNVDVPSGAPYTEVAGYLQDSGLGGGMPADESTVWIVVQSLLRIVRESATSVDMHAFDHLIAHARTRGWLDQTGEKVRVRLVYY